MLIEDANADLRAMGESLFALVRQLGGGRPTLSADCYRTEIPGAPALYFRFIGNRARTYAKNSVHLATEWHESLASIPGVTKGNNWYGSRPSADICARPGHPDEVENAREFVRRTFGSTKAAKPSVPTCEPSTPRMRPATPAAMTSESSRFPFGDCGEIRRLATVYWDLITPTEAAEERRFERDFAEARKQGFLPKELFIRIGRWKSVRQTPNYESNSVESVHAATADAFTADDATAFAALMRLKGVALRTASAILHWMRPDRFPILDVRVVAALGLTQSASYEDVEFYSLVATRVRELARECDMDLRTMDRALWAWDKLRSRRRA